MLEFFQEVQALVLVLSHRGEQFGSRSGSRELHVLRLIQGERTPATDRR